MSDRAENRIKYHYFKIEWMVIDEFLPRIGPSAFTLYCVLCRIAGDHDQCFPGTGYLCLKTGQSKMTVLKSIATLKEFGLIEVEPQENERGGSGSNLYLILPMPDRGEKNKILGVQKLDSPRLKNRREGVQKLDSKDKSPKNNINKNIEQEDVVKASFEQARKKLKEG